VGRLFHSADTISAGNLKGEFFLLVLRTDERATHPAIFTKKDMAGNPRASESFSRDPLGSRFLKSSISAVSAGRKGEGIPPERVSQPRVRLPHCRHLVDVVEVRWTETLSRSRPILNRAGWGAGTYLWLRDF